MRRYPPPLDEGFGARLVCRRVARFTVPFNAPAVVGNELEYLRQALASDHWSGNGPFTRRCEQWLQERIGAERALLTHSCTAALEMAAHLCNVSPGDEVILPPYTFVTTASAFALRGARPVFVDIRADTLNLDESLVERAFTERTRAVVAVHYAGVGCEMDVLDAIVRRHGVRLVEDAAQAIGAAWRSRPLGGVGDIGCLSFHETKNVGAGEGGALLLRDAELVERAEILLEKGTNRRKFFRGQVDKYTWVDLGSSYLPSELTAACLLGQLERADDVRRRRLDICRRYREGLADLESAGWLRLPVVPADCTPNGHLFFVLTAEERQRDALIEHLAASGVQAPFHYVPLHESPMGRSFGYRPGDFPVAESISRRLLRLPLFASIEERRQEQVIRAVREFFA
jgi:dTDP-4-amino-4,6-dideoxygalactose transaminase